MTNIKFLEKLLDNLLEETRNNKIKWSQENTDTINSVYQVMFENYNIKLKLKEVIDNYDTFTEWILFINNNKVREEFESILDFDFDRLIKAIKRNLKSIEFENWLSCVLKIEGS